MYILKIKIMNRIQKIYFTLKYITLASYPETDKAREFLRDQRLKAAKEQEKKVANVSLLSYSIGHTSKR